MGTRAQFFLGNPQDLVGRRWLGCVHWDGYPDGDCKIFAKVKTEDEFLAAVDWMKANRTDFCDPSEHGFPYPWDNNLFLTDCTYAFFDGQSMFTWFHRGFVPLAKYSRLRSKGKEAYSSGKDTLPENIPAPTKRDASGDSSIIIVRMAAP